MKIGTYETSGTYGSFESFRSFVSRGSPAPRHDSPLSDSAKGPRSPMPSTAIAENLAEVRRRIAAAARRAGRDPAAVRLVAVSKYRSMDEIRAVVEAGQLDLAENRVQEAQEKVETLARLVAPARPVWHLIGHLQSNKAKYVVDLFDLVHSVDTVKVAEALQIACEKKGRDSLDILVQINVSGEESKSGLAPGEAEGAIRAIAAMGRLRVKGLMTMAPYEAAPEDTRPVFRGLRELRDSLKALRIPGVALEDLSMGMTNDYEVAVEEGATLVRIGTAIFEGWSA